MRVTKSRLTPDGSTSVTTPGAIMPIIAWATLPASGEWNRDSRYQPPKQKGSHRKVRKMKRPTASRGMGDRLPARHARPHQPDDKHVQHDERLPQVEMRPLE